MTASDASATRGAKNHYNRVRPFEGDGSHPSGHTAIGLMLALVLTDLVPEKQNELLKRGCEYGESRMVCWVHGLSDTTAGRVIAFATLARLQSDPTFEAQRELPRAEVARSIWTSV